MRIRAILRLSCKMYTRTAGSRSHASLGETEMSSHKIAVVAGDGIGKEVAPEGIRVLEAAGKKFGIDFQWDELPWSCDHYLKHGRMMPEDGLEQIRHHDAIFLGAVGYPTVPDHVSLWGLLIPIRRGFQQYANIRPIRLMPGIQSPLRDRQPGDIDFIVVRENNEGEYSAIGGVAFEDTDDEVVMQTSVFSRRGVDRIMRYAFELARSRPAKRLSSATKSNGISISMPYWDKRFEAMAEQYPDVTPSQFHIDIMAAHFVRNPNRFDVVVASNLFGDILSDLGPACTGTIAIAPSANLNPEREYPSMFEPVHGSAPDIHGQNIANPIGQIWSGAMMLDHLGHKEAGEAVVRAIEVVLTNGPRTPDIGGTASTQEVGRAIAEAV
jgi:tartrate dehydrogenase/decarboxylase / D-malate dehydrogenase